jgi:hypothetical protein
MTLELLLRYEREVFVTYVYLSYITQKIVTERKEYETRGIRAILSQMRWFAGNQIRNAACIAGNIVTASPISDLNPVFVATVSEIKTLIFEYAVNINW